MQTINYVFFFKDGRDKIEISRFSLSEAIEFFNLRFPETKISSIQISNNGIHTSHQREIKCVKCEKRYRSTSGFISHLCKNCGSNNLTLPRINTGRKRSGSRITRGKVFERDKNLCRYCGRKADHLDHVFPYKSGGKASFDNLVCACLKCGKEKDSKTLEELNWKLLPIPNFDVDYAKIDSETDLIILGVIKSLHAEAKRFHKRKDIKSFTNLMNAANRINKQLISECKNNKRKYPI